MLTHTTARANAFITNETAAFDSGSGVAQMLFYSGSPPGAGTTINPANNALLVTLPLLKPSWGAPNASRTASLLGVPLTATVGASGNIGCYRSVDSAGNIVHEGAVATSGAEIIMSNVTVVAGGQFTLNSYQLIGAA